MAKVFVYRKPRDTKKTLLHLGRYLGFHKWTLALVALLVLVSTAANVVGTYLFRPIINDYILPGDIPGLVRALAAMGVMYALGALATLGYSQLMVHAAQKVVTEIRRDLFAHVQKLPLRYFDANTHGELMSRFTNDVDTVQEALNNSFCAAFCRAFSRWRARWAMLVVLSAQLSLIVVAFLVVMGLFIRFNSLRSRRYFQAQQQQLGRINGFVEEMVAGQKVEKVFNHEQADFEEFCRRNEALRKAATSALTYSGLMVPMNVSLSYANYAVSACVGGLFALAGRFDLGRACGLPCVCAPKRPAAQSAFAAGQLHPGGTVGRGAHFRPDGRAGGAGRGRCDTVPREEGRVRRAGAG